jgi:16S rRNA C967 or C1407 C5-methylase (RsmB/RsmF family)
MFMSKKKASNKGKAQQKGHKGEAGFHHHYHNIYEKSWENLRKSLLSPKHHIALPELSKEYHIDEASTLPPLLLAPKTGEHILDMCAAPGGKSLQLATALKGTGRLVLNELSQTRRTRLRKVIEQHLPEEWQDNISIWGQDASLLGLKSPDRFDKILLDAPCSSERHLMENPQELSQWSIKRSKHLAQRQMALLCSALELLKPNGLLVYSTCSISPLENELNIAKFLKKRREKVSLKKLQQLTMSHLSLEAGVMIRPDLHQGLGPIFAVALQKQEEAVS